MNSIYLLIPIAIPLLSFLLISILGKTTGRTGSNILAVMMIVLACISSWLLLMQIILNQEIKEIVLAPWFTLGNIKVNWSIYLDSLSSIMIIVVTTISALVHIYSIGYMSEDKDITRFMAHLSLFTFMMLVLVSSGNLIQMFCGWEGVGLASYLLIGHWHERPRANHAAIKAFIVNRLADVGFLTATIACCIMFQSCDIRCILSTCFNYTDYAFRWYTASFNSLELISILFFIATMAKSAQLGLHIWLPDAMEGPTPVSALLHAATMVTAGIFLLARLSPLYELAPYCRNLITIIGILTSLFGASMALVQYDIKKIIAYSTCSQLGYMVMAGGLSLYNLAVFHLVTHAFFKALLFLGAGSIIHSMNGEQDIRKMKAIARYMPLTFTLMCIGALSLIGIPLFSGFYSKDAILIGAWSIGTTLGSLAFWSGNIVALITALYTCRLLYKVFGRHMPVDHHVNTNIYESKPIMLMPMVILALASICVGYMGTDYFEHTLHHKNLTSVRAVIHILPVAFSICGLFLSLAVYTIFASSSYKVRHKCRWIVNFIEAKWYFDIIYQKLIVKNIEKLGLFLWQRFDQTLIDKNIILATAELVQRISARISTLQSGYLNHYTINVIVATAMMIFWLLYMAMRSYD